MGAAARPAFCLLKPLLSSLGILAVVVNGAEPVPELPGDPRAEFPPWRCPCPEVAEKTAGSPTEEGQAGQENTATVCTACVVPITSRECPYPDNVSIVPLLPLGGLSCEKGDAPGPSNLAKWWNPKEKELLLFSVTTQSS